MNIHRCFALIFLLQGAQVSAQKSDFVNEFTLQGLKPGDDHFAAIDRLKSLGFDCSKPQEFWYNPTILGEVQAKVNMRYNGTFSKIERYYANTVRCTDPKTSGVDIYIKPESYFDGVKILFVSVHYSYRNFTKDNVKKWALGEFGKPTEMNAENLTYCSAKSSVSSGLCNGTKLLIDFHNPTTEAKLEAGSVRKDIRESMLQRRLTLEYQRAKVAHCSQLRGGCQ